jgi:undecaprenyl-diphosphatase
MSLQELDVSAFKAVNGLGLAPLDWLFVLVSMPEFGLAVAGLLAAYFAWRRKWEAVGIILAGIAAVALCDSVGARLLKPFFGRVRPCFALPKEAVRQLVPIAPSGSMPSLHAANNMAAAMVAFLAERRTGWVLFPLAGFVSLSRVGVGVHWPGDLLGGLLWGALCAAIAWGLWFALRRRWLRRRAAAPAEPAA